MKIVAAIHDLMFSSKVNAAAQGRPISWVPRGTAPAEHVAKEGADVLLIDLDARHFDAIAAVRAVKQASPGVVVIGYVGHEKTDIIEAAKAAGADRVLAKGEFARRLPELLQEEQAET